MKQKTLHSFFAQPSCLHHDAASAAAALSIVPCSQQQVAAVVSLGMRPAAAVGFDHGGAVLEDAHLASLNGVSDDGCGIPDGSFLPIHQFGEENHTATDECAVSVPFRFPRKKRTYLPSLRIRRAELRINSGPVDACLHISENVESGNIYPKDEDAKADLTEAKVLLNQETCHQAAKSGQQYLDFKSNQDNGKEDGALLRDNNELEDSLRMIVSESQLVADVPNCASLMANNTSAQSKSFEILHATTLRTYTRSSKRQKQNAIEQTCVYPRRLAADGTLATSLNGEIDLKSVKQLDKATLASESDQRAAVSSSIPPVQLEPEILPAFVHSIRSDSAKRDVAESYGGDPCMQLEREKSRRVAAPLQALEAPITDYEIERADNIRKNSMFLQKLGISSTVASIGRASYHHPRYKPKNKVNILPNIPLRRSSRINELSTNSSKEQSLDGGLMLESSSETIIEPISYDDSSVWVYTCGNDMVSTNVTSWCSIDMELEIKGFQSLSRYLYDPSLTRIYSMDVACVERSDRALLAAGGHQGRMAVFGTHIGCNSHFQGDYASSKTDLEANASLEILPLLSWKGCKGWISQVKFLSEQPQEGSMLLLSSSNDSSLILWDINKQEQKHPQVSTGNWKGSPMIVAEAESLHSDGIFGMHETSCQIATASKDGTIAYCRISDAKFVKERSISGHHSSTIKCVRFRDKHVVADGGADGLICILDLRLPQPCTLNIHDTHASGINVVEWNPCDENMLLSASNDPHLLLHDIRNHLEPLHKLIGHMSPQLHRSSRIYRPTFVAKGHAVATPGEGSKQISLYSVSSGKAISRGHVGFDANMVMSNSYNTSSTSQLWIGSRKIAEYAPFW
ncbi:hypothetical protein O6H91_13G050500 [Diphasiastrum complanatum]|uniref:Uncharacterized protein n=1 Tax=Diphasiastrum complanatum TaxID=34168 RepID=A0ACC2BUN9_DIPCM|nr:hypothetical protein O6H91_13G050500 [Diphasiastrum complanatum]